MSAIVSLVKKFTSSELGIAHFDLIHSAVSLVTNTRGPDHC